MRRIVIMALVILLPMVSGCSSLAKKFIRKPKEKASQVVAPQSDYQLDPRMVYERHFVFAKVWIDEFKSSVDSKSRKRQRESVEQAIRNLEILNDYIPEEYADKKEKLKKYIQELRQIYSDLEKLQRARLSLTRIKNRIEELRREFHREFLPSRQSEEFYQGLIIR